MEIKRRRVFTFHNVSINSFDIQALGDDLDEIYIPQCFY